MEQTNEIHDRYEDEFVVTNKLKAMVAIAFLAGVFQGPINSGVSAVKEFVRNDTPQSHTVQGELPDYNHYVKANETTLDTNEPTVDKRTHPD